ncbi:MAG: hypothetical protein ACR2H5_09950 [Ktedonobacteraceae bacterium]
MVRRGTGIYRVLFIISFLIALVLVFFSLSFNTTASIALLIISLFFFVIAFSYFHLSGQENRS